MQYAVVTQVSPLLVRPRGTSSGVPAVKLAHVGTLAVNDQIAYDLIDPKQTDKGSVGTLVVVGKMP